MGRPALRGPGRRAPPINPSRPFGARYCRATTKRVRSRVAGQPRGRRARHSAAFRGRSASNRTAPAPWTNARGRATSTRCRVPVARGDRAPRLGLGQAPSPTVSEARALRPTERARPPSAPAPWAFRVRFEPPAPTVLNRRPGPFHRAGEGIRTLDPKLGKLVLYQLSYSRDEADHSAVLPSAKDQT
jgi:hypothetical protein